jgi:NADPH-dependent 2,4-dienoyl-CoA reductase/sulfur reductase-like enzyme
MFSIFEHLFDFFATKSKVASEHTSKAHEAENGFITHETKIKLDSPDAHTVLDVPILIVGGGPTGLLLAYLLAKLGGTSATLFLILSSDKLT